MAGKRALVVDDEDDIRDGARLWLNAAGYQTEDARNGQQCLEAARALLPDVILLDVQMPGIDGMQAMEQLHADSLTARIPVVMFSASLRDEQRALDAGARFFVPKPCGGKRLIEAVNAAVLAAR